jgi:hypothetical protein
MSLKSQRKGATMLQVKGADRHTHTHTHTYSRQTTHIFTPNYTHIHTKLHTYSHQTTHIFTPNYTHIHTKLHTYSHQTTHIKTAVVTTLVVSASYHGSGCQYYSLLRNDAVKFGSGKAFLRRTVEHKNYF